MNDSLTVVVSGYPSCKMDNFIEMFEEAGINVKVEQVGEKISGRSFEKVWLDHIINEVCEVSEEPLESKKPLPGDKPWLSKKKGRNNFGRK